jgi:hypothetical protein
MKRILLIASIAISPVLFSACSASSAKENKGSTADINNASTKASTASDTTVKYTCPMHPEVISDTPGACPKCGMTMVIKDKNKKSNQQKMQMDTSK